MEVGPELDAARFRVVEGGLTPDAIRELTPVVSALPFEALGPVKQSLKRFFSDAAWTADDDDALADIVGAGTGGGNRELAPGLVLTWAWEGGRFRLRVESDAGGEDGGAPASAGDATGLGQTFDGAVVPEATPSPRTIRFATPPLEGGAARNYESATAASADPRVARLFGDFDEVTNVLVGPDFVAVTIGRPNRWEQLLEPILREVTSEFAGNAPLEHGESTIPGETAAARDVTSEDGARAPRRLERAWADLGALRGDRPDDLERILAACGDTDAARRQVAVALLADAPPDAAAGAWASLVGDSSRAVRRSAVDAIAGAARRELRPLLERALGDTDAWIRWKALSGIGVLGAESSRAAIVTVAEDPDFRVRLEAARLLKG